MNKAYKIRIYPNKEQIQTIEKTFGCSRFIYNYFLAQRIDLYKNQGKSIGYIDQQNQLPILKKEFIWLKEVDSTSLQMSLRNLDKAFKNFFRDKSIGFPKFKNKKNNKKTYTVNYVNNNIQIKKNTIKLPKLQWIEAKVHRYVQGRIISTTISKSPTGKYFVSIITEANIKPTDKKAKAKGKIGIDLGITHFATLSSGEKIENPKYLKKTLEKLAREQRSLSHKQKYSNNWYKAKKKVAKLHEKVKQQRADSLHKLSKRIIDENQIIILEDLVIKNMIKNHKLSKDIADASWYKFYSFLEYKAKWYGKTIHKIDRWYPSSKTCYYCCHVLDEIPLNTRKWDCPNCHTKDIDRDKNASLNILKQGLLEIAEIA
ncbi:MAG: transposase [Desulfitibacter sp. BRH_c19]|nr:MAG: transposase [Desulfitibacter sp. BRH_c19]